MAMLSLPLWDIMRPMHLACMIRVATCGNGASLSTKPTLTGKTMAEKTPRQEISACDVEAGGRVATGTVGQQHASGMTQGKQAVILVFGWYVALVYMHMPLGLRILPSPLDLSGRCPAHPRSKGC